MDSEDYSDMKPPYMPKNGPMDDITELLKVRGVEPEMFWGVGKAPGDANAGDGQGRGLVDLFCALSSNTVNVNTASAEVLSVVYGVDVSVIQETLISKRAGPDGQDGTEDDAPFPNVAAASAVVGAPPGGGGAGLPGGAVPGAPGGTPPPGAPGPMRLGTQSTVFEVRVEAHMGGSFRRFVAMVDRRNARDPRILYFRRD